MANYSGMSQVYSLDSILLKIENNNPSILKFNYEMKALDTYAKGAKNWDAPQIGTGLFMMPYSFKNGGSYMLSTQQMFPNSKKLKAKTNYMKGMSSIKLEKQNVTKIQLITQAKTIYYQWLILKKKQKVLVGNENILNALIKSLELEYSYGKGKLSSIYKAKANLAQLENTKLIIKNDIQQKNIALNTLMNQNKETIFDIDTSYTINNYEITNIDSAVLNSIRSDMKLLDNSIQLVKLNQEFQRSKRKPDFGVRYDNMLGIKSHMFAFNLMGMITIPIVPWSSREVKANLTAMDFEIKGFEVEKNSIVNEVTVKFQLIKTKITNKKQQLSLFEKNIIPALENNYKISLATYKENNEELFMVLDALQTLKMTQIEYLNQLMELLLLQVEYENEMQIK